MAEIKILIIDNEEKNNTLSKMVLANRGYNVNSALTGRLGLDVFMMNKYDVVLLNMGISDMDPLYLMEELKKQDTDVIIIICVAPEEVPTVQMAFNQGAYDYITKPVKPDELYFTVKRAVAQRQFQVNYKRSLQGMEERNISLQKQNIMLAKRIEESTKNLTRLYEDLRNTYMLTIKSLAQAIDARDHYTHSHSESVARYARIIALEVKVDAQKLEDIEDACQLHDIGKIGIFDNVLSKPGKLTPEEFEQVKQHSLKGAQILEPLTFLEGVTKLVKQHHERYDGRGYPYGLKGEEIDIGARIMSVADTYDAMVSARPYRQNPCTKQEAVDEIKKHSGTQFDPKIVEAFLRVVERL